MNKEKKEKSKIRLLTKLFQELHNIIKEQNIRIVLLEGKTNQLIDVFNNHYGNHIEYLNTDITHGRYGKEDIE